MDFIFGERRVIELFFEINISEEFYFILSRLSFFLDLYLHTFFTRI